MKPANPPQPRHQRPGMFHTAREALAWGVLWFGLAALGFALVASVVAIGFWAVEVLR